MKILVADDDPQLVRALRITLAAHGYDVVAAPDGAAAIALAAQAHPDIVLLDLGMPRLDGVQVIEALRGWTTAPDHRRVGPHRVGRQGRGAGCRRRRLRDEAVPDRRAARAAARAVPADRAARPTTRSSSFGDVAVDLAAKAVTRAGARVHLTPTEWRMLEFLARNPGALVTRQTLLKEIWGERAASPTPAICGCTCRSCARSSRRTPRARSTCSPSRAWATGWSLTHPKKTAGEDDHAGKARPSEAALSTAPGSGRGGRLCDRHRSRHGAADAADREGRTGRRVARSRRSSPPRARSASRGSPSSTRPPTGPRSAR